MHFLRDVLHLVFPRVCPGCDISLSDQDGAVCLHCLYDIEQTHFHHCPQDNDLYFRFAGKVPLEGAAALYYFDKQDKLQKIISALKYQSLPQVGAYLGEFYASVLKESEFLPENPILVPVPLHRSKMAKRGYNQSEAIVQGMAGNLPGATGNTGALIRKKKTASQTRKSREERWQNVRSMFQVRRPLTGNIILVDDVITTGSTLEACIRALLMQPEIPKSIRVLSLGAARKN